ncbi:C-C motif chemokine 17 [Entelurus aequoreus]|uniref:C-C motif chemokine 17 n=1 Tax=Entelurus aequoreus TaxID=161455 RepID=UPI002B1D8B35|nr:C-C motif chemokine 17 [Entelurus aequoreus]
MRKTAVTMKTLVLLTLMCFLQVSMCSVVHIMFKNNGCCSKSIEICIPLKKVQHVGRTSQGCTHQAIVVKTVEDNKFCLKPSWKWAKYLLQEFEGSSVNNTSPPERCVKSRDY